METVPITTQDLVDVRSFLEWLQRLVRGAEKGAALLTLMEHSEGRLGDIQRETAELLGQRDVLLTEIDEKTLLRTEHKAALEDMAERLKTQQATWRAESRQQQAAMAAERTAAAQVLRDEQASQVLTHEAAIRVLRADFHLAQTEYDRIQGVLIALKESIG
jgi:uncharacterized protein YoxC